MPRVDRLSPGQVALLQEAHIAHFVTLMRDGSPHVTPMWVDVDPEGGQILINTVDDRQKVKNVARNAQVAVSVMDCRDPERWVSVRGSVVERRHERAREHADFLARKYTGAENYTLSRPNEKRVVLCIRPQHVLAEGV